MCSVTPNAAIAITSGSGNSNLAGGKRSINAPSCNAAASPPMGLVSFMPQTRIISGAAGPGSRCPVTPPIAAPVARHSPATRAAPGAGNRMQFLVAWGRESAIVVSELIIAESWGRLRCLNLPRVTVLSTTYLFMA